MTAPVSSVHGLYSNPLIAVLTPVIDVAFGSITASYTTFNTIVAASAILVLNNFTNVIIDYTLSGGISTQGHLGAGDSVTLDLKSNQVVASGSVAVGFKANSALPSSGFCSLTNIALP